MLLLELSSGELSIVGVSGEENRGFLMLYNPLKSYQWSTICSTQWDDTDAHVACRQMGFSGGVSKTYRYTQWGVKWKFRFLNPNWKMCVHN